MRVRWEQIEVAKPGREVPSRPMKYQESVDDSGHKERVNGNK